MNEGHINIFRKMIEWQWYKNQNTKDLFIHYLLKANWKDGWFEGILIPRGSLATSRKTIFEETGLSIQSQRTSERQLQKTNDIVLKSTNKFMLVTIVNYDKYQVLEKKSTINQQSTNNQLTTIEEFKEFNNSNKKEIIKEKSYFENEELNSIFIDFLQLRTKLKAQNTDRAINLLIGKLNHHVDSIKIKMIEKSIENSWKGLFELKQDKPYKPIEQSVPEWYDKKIEIKQASADEESKMKAMLEEFEEEERK